MTNSGAERARTLRALPLAQREMALLLVLSVVASVLFVGTSLLAAWSRQQQANEAAEWHIRGETLLQGGNDEAAITALRHAVAADRASVPYSLGLARGLARAGRNTEASRILERLREDRPEDVEINHLLARLAVARGDVAVGARYYHNAMYGVASDSDPSSRHAIALELAGVFLEHGQRDGALAELIALAADLDGSAPEQFPVATLFLRAGDASRARVHFLEAAKAGSAAALAGAGAAALAAHDFAAAEQYSRDAARQGADVTGQLRIVRSVLAADPLAVRIRSEERARRLLGGLRMAAIRLSSCRSTGAADVGIAPVEQDLARFQVEHRAAALRNLDVIEQGLALIVHAVAATEQCSGNDSDVDRTWRLIGEAHGIARP